MASKRAGLEVVTPDPYNAGTPFSALTSDLTAGNLVYVRNHFPVPEMDPDSWKLIVHGSLEKSLSLSLAEIQSRPQKTVTMTLECAGNGRTSMEPRPGGTPWDYNAVSIVEFTGTPLSILLEEVGIQESAREVVFVGSDRGKVPQGREVAYTRSLPKEVAMKPDILLAWEMNGQPLSPDHGFPLRLVVPGWYGMASVKWLMEIKVVEEPFEGFFQNEHYVYAEEEGTEEGGPVRQIRVRSLILKPETGMEFERKLIELTGIAYSGQGEILKVELSFDAGISWETAKLEEASSIFTAQKWSFSWEPDAPGVYNLLSRATDSVGNTQPIEQRWNRLGYGNNGVQEVIITIE